MDETAYLTKVRQVLDELGSPDSSADITGSGDYWKHCRQAGIDAKVCAATIYTGERHRHEIARTVIKENASAASEDVQSESWKYTYAGWGIIVFPGDGRWHALATKSGATDLRTSSRSKYGAVGGIERKIDHPEERANESAESPVREEWEVVVKRAGADADSITSSAGRRPDEVTAGNAVFAGFKDDEKAASFAKKMTKAGYISSFGPRRDYTLHEEVGEQRTRDIDEHALEELDLYTENTAELYPQKKAILRNLEAKIARGVYDQELAAKLWLYWVDAGAKMYAKEFADEHMWKVIYPKPLRMELARRVARREYAEMKLQSASEDHRQWHKVIFNSEVAAQVFREEIERGPYEANLLGKNVFTNAPYDVIVRTFEKTGVHGSVHREAEESSTSENPTPAVEEVAAECDSCIPWQKVSRDATAASNNAELAKKYGAIKNAKDVYRIVGDAMNKETQEVFLVIPLDLRGELKAPPYEVARGQVSRVSVDTADVLRAALHAGAEAYICVHQHPTGKATPSKADRDLTKSIKDATAVHGKSLTFVDHVVIGQKRAYSIGENKMYKC